MSILDANLTAVSIKLIASRSNHENDLLVEIKVIEVRAGKAESRLCSHFPKDVVS